MGIPVPINTSSVKFGAAPGSSPGGQNYRKGSMVDQNGLMFKKGATPTAQRRG